MPAISGTAFASREDEANPRPTVLTYIIVAFAFSSVFWYLITTTPAVAANGTSLLMHTVAAI